MKKSKPILDVDAKPAPKTVRDPSLPKVRALVSGYVHFTPAIAAEICVRIASGEILSAICKDSHMPTDRSVYYRLSTDEVFSEQFSKAQADRTWSMAEDILDIADNGTNDWMERNQGRNLGWVANGEAIQRSKVRVDTRKWLMSKMLPKKYGDKVTNELTGADGGPIEFSRMNDEELKNYIKGATRKISSGFSGKE